MATRYMTSDELISSIKRRAMIPTSQNTFQNDDFLQFATEEMYNDLVPSVLELHEAYYLHSYTVAIEASKSAYAIPYRAIGNKLKDVYYEDSGGNRLELSRIDVEDLPYYEETYLGNSLQFFYVRANEIVLVPSIGSTNPGGSLVMHFYMAPNQIVVESRAGLITDINTSTGVITLSEYPDNFPTSTAAISTDNFKLDLIMHQSPHKTLAYDIIPTAVDKANKTITIATTDIPTDLTTYDYLMQSEETIIPQIPDELHSILAQMVAIRCLESMGDSEKLQVAMAKLNRMIRNIHVLIDNRVEGAPQKIINFNSFINKRIGRF